MKNKIISSALAFTALALISCNKEEYPNSGEPVTGVNVTVHTLEAGATKTAIAYNGDSGKYIPTWLASDKMAVWADNVPTSGSSAPTYLNNSAAGETAAFTGSLDITTGEHILYGYASSGYTNVEYSADGVIFEIPAIQHPTATSFDPMADLLIAWPMNLTVAEGESSVTVNDARFTRPLAVVNLLLTDGTTGSILSGKEISSVTLSTSDAATDPLAGRVTIDVKGNGSVAGITGNTNVSAEFTAENPLAINGSNPILMVVNPLTFSDNAELTITVKATDLELAKTINAAGGKLQAGNVGRLPVTLTDSDIVLNMEAVTVNGTAVTKDASTGVYQAVLDLTQHGTLTISGYTPGFDGWILDPDYISATEADGVFTFLPVDGKYKVMLETENKYIRFYRMNSEGTALATLASDKTGAIWLIGSECVGKPGLAQNIDWNTGRGLCMSQIEEGKFQITLVAGSQLYVDGIDFKFFHQQGWGGEFTAANISTASQLVRISESGNVYKKADNTVLTAGTSYTFIVDLTNATSTPGDGHDVWTGAVLSVKIDGVDEPVADVVMSAGAAEYGYTYTGNIEQGNSISVIGISDIGSYYFDPDYFTTGKDGGYVFNAVSGSYKVDFYSADKYVRVSRLAADGTYATLADGGLWLRGYGVATPYMNGKEFGWDENGAYCVAEVKSGIFQFTGLATGQYDNNVGGRFRYDYISSKYYFGYNWNLGEAASANIVLAEGTEALLKVTDTGNLELADGVSLDSGSTYRLTIDLSEVSYDGASSTGTQKIAFEKIQ